MTLTEVHRYSSQHRAILQQSQHCGCFYCLEVFEYSEIEDWIDDEQTAMCPHCGVDAVLPRFPQYVEKDLLNAMHQLFFNR